MPSAIYSVSVTAGGVAIQKAVTRTGDHPQGYEVSLPPGKAGSLTTRTDNDTGVITAAGHTLIVGDKVDVYWAGGMRYGMTVSAVTGNDVTVGTGAGEIGAGDNFPVQGTAVVITKQVPINTAIDGDAIQVIALCAEANDPSSIAKAHVDMQDAGSATIEEIDLIANVPVVHDIASGATANVFSGNPIASTKASSGSSTETLTLKIVSLEDSTP